MTLPLTAPQTRQNRSILLVKAVITLAVGAHLVYCLTRPSDLPSKLQWLFLATAAVISIFQISRQLLDNLNRSLTNHRARSALIIFIFSALYLLTTALLQHRDLLPELHDENAYALQARMLAHSGLWMPALPLPQFFDTFFVFTKPVYASIYFPGTALVNAPGMLLHLPIFLTPLLISAAAVALIFSIFCRLFDGLTGLLAVFLLLSGMPFRRLSITVMSHPLMLAEGAAMILLFLRWQSSRKTRDLVLLGAITGLALITRPADALCYAIPLAIAVLNVGWALPTACRDGGQCPPYRKTLRQISFALLAMLPFLALQLILNLGTTGHLLQTPYSLYLDQFQPGSQPGFHQLPAALFADTPLHKQMYFQNLLLPGLRQHTLANLPKLWLYTRFPDLLRLAYYACPAIAIFCCLYCLNPRVRAWRIMAGIFALMILCYSINPMFLIHYALSFLTILIFPLLAVIYTARTRWPISRIAAFLPLALIAICISSLPEFDPKVQDAWHSPLMRFVNQQLPTMVKKPAVVLFTVTPQDDINEEPAYNIDSANPDDAQIIHANDMGARNNEIFAYYAHHQPSREFYIFDRTTKQLTDLGSAADLARQKN